MRVVIVGAGAVGIMTAWRLARAGQEVVALEQFRIDHDRGSSYGDSRIVRRVYPDPLYTTLMADAYRLWNELMAEAGDSGLFVQTGGIFCGAADHPQVQAAQEALAASRGASRGAGCGGVRPAFSRLPRRIERGRGLRAEHGLCPGIALCPCGRRTRPTAWRADSRGV